MKYNKETIEVKTRIRKATQTTTLPKKYEMNDTSKITLSNGEEVIVPIRRIIHSGSFIGYREYANRRYTNDLENVNGEITLKLEIVSPIITDRIPKIIKKYLQKHLTKHRLVPYWQCSCYNVLETRTIYTKEKYEKGLRSTNRYISYLQPSVRDGKYKRIGHGDVMGAMNPICMITDHPCTDFTTGDLYLNSEGDLLRRSDLGNAGIFNIQEE